MKLEETHITEIRTAFEKMNSKSDFLNLLNYAKPFVYGEKAVPFDLKQLTFFSLPEISQTRKIKSLVTKKRNC